MLTSIELHNFGPLNEFDWPNLGRINLIIGGNGSGKTFLLKAIYSAIRTLEEYKRGDDQRTISEILYEKLYWTFQADKIGNLVTKGAKDGLSCTLRFDQYNFSYGFGKNTSQKITSLKNTVPPRTSNSIFLPAKEILSLQQIVLKSREQDKSFGFDDTYLDLARALRQSPKIERNGTEFTKSRKNLEDIIGGRVDYDEMSGRWQYKKGNQTFSVGVTAEGVKKIAILDILLDNRYLNTNSIVFIDEPESALHPMAITQLLGIIAELAESGIQFFLASHSYFVLKKLYMIAQNRNISIPIISSHESRWTCEDLKSGMPDNSIIDESIRLYEEEVWFALK